MTESRGTGNDVKVGTVGTVGRGRRMGILELARTSCLLPLVNVSKQVTWVTEMYFKKTIDRMGIRRCQMDDDEPGR